MSVLTVYDCGTAFDENSTDIIAVTAKNTQGVRGKDWIINAGVGSDAAMKQKIAPPTFGGVAKAAIQEAVLGSVVGRFAASPVGQKYIAQGAGVGLNDATVATLAAVARVKPTKVNFFGWSRGSISSIRTVNELAKAAPSVRCNLFLHDPVIGDPLLNQALYNNASTAGLGKNVDELVVIQQMDASDFIFQSHSVFGAQTNAAKQSRVLPMPGPHSGSVCLEDPKYVMAYMICKGLAEDFLTRNGTQLKKVMAVQDRRYLEWYSDLWLTLVGKKVGYMPESGLISNRAEATGFENNLVVRVFFNQHHIDLLGAVAPKTTLALLNALMTRLRPHEQLLQAAAEAQKTTLPGLLPKTRTFVEHVSIWMRIFGTRRT